MAKAPKQTMQNQKAFSSLIRWSIADEIIPSLYRSKYRVQRTSRCATSFDHIFLCLGRRKSTATLLDYRHCPLRFHTGRTSFATTRSARAEKRGNNSLETRSSQHV